MYMYLPTCTVCISTALMRLWGTYMCVCFHGWGCVSANLPLHSRFQISRPGEETVKATVLLLLNHQVRWCPPPPPTPPLKSSTHLLPPFILLFVCHFPLSCASPLCGLYLSQFPLQTACAVQAGHEAGTSAWHTHGHTTNHHQCCLAVHQGTMMDGCGRLGTIMAAGWGGAMFGAGGCVRVPYVHRLGGHGVEVAAGRRFCQEAWGVVLAVSKLFCRCKVFVKLGRV